MNSNKVVQYSENSLVIDNLSKAFPGVQALDSVTISAKPGEILGLVGVNGAGKSTLMNILGGLIQPDSGRIYIDGKEVLIENARVAGELGIAFIQQEIQVFDTLRVYENIYISNLYKWRKGQYSPGINRNALRRNATEYLKTLRCDIPVDTYTSRLTVGEKQMIQIARALSQGGRILLFDEPTASLSTKEAESLFKVIKSLAASGMTVIYISHYLDEIFGICDRATVLRDGKVTGTDVIGNLTRKILVNYMIGRDIDEITSERGTEFDKVVLDARNISGELLPKDVSFRLHEGEILGIWGLLGSGRSEMIRTLLGFDRMTSGEIQFRKSDNLLQVSPKELFRHSGYLTEARHHDGLFLQMPLWQNITSSILGRFASRFFRFLNRRKELTLSRQYMEEVGVKATDEQMLTYQLSGGNQQKVIVAKWFLKNSKILFMDEPTKGVDVGAKVEIQRMIFERAERGISFVVVSSEMDEIMALCDRIIVLHNGHKVAEIPKKDFTKDRLMNGLAVEEA